VKGQLKAGIAGLRNSGGFDAGRDTAFFADMRQVDGEAVAEVDH
jgi:hypothetical protein